MANFYQPHLPRSYENNTIDLDHAKLIMQKINEDDAVRDVNLYIDMTCLPAHKVVLASYSKYFKIMFTCGLIETTGENVSFTGVDINTLKTILKYIYNSTLDLTDNTVELILKTAYLFQVHKIVHACCDYLFQRIALDNSIGILSLAELYNLMPLKDLALRFVNENFLSIYEQNEFLNLCVDQLSKILKSDDIAVEAEEQVFICITVWIDHNKTIREIHLFRLLKLVKISLITPMFVNNQMKEYCKSSPKCLALIMENFLLPKNFKAGPKRRAFPKYSMEKLIIVGDFGRENMDIKKYVPSSNSWKLCTVLDNRKYAFGVVAIENGKIIVLGGLKSGVLNDIVDCINLKTTCIFQIAPMLKECHSFGVAAVGRGDKLSVFVVGGQNGNNFLDTVQKWSSITEEWSLVSQMLHPRHGFGLSTYDSKLYVAGGWNTCDTLNYVEVYDPRLDLWTECSPMNMKRRSIGMATVGKFLYAIGGLNKHGDVLSSVEKYDPENNVWTFVRDMPCARHGLKAVGLSDGNMVILGGSENPPEVFIYNTKSNEWDGIAPIPEVYHSIGVVVAI